MVKRWQACVVETRDATCPCSLALESITQSRVYVLTRA